MNARALALAVVVTGCLQPELVPCGDLACPAGYLCIAELERCAPPNAYDVCADLAEGDACRIDERLAGRCTNGACITASCGNDVVEPGEACDDGNQVTETEGDVRCNATCTSDQTCGNGVIDPGEGCDCGATIAAGGCTSPNASTTEATCRPDCTPARCGDGIQNGEELCDGAAPANTSCFGFGFDLGAMSCSGCGPGFDACHQLGWERAHHVVDAVRELAGRDGRIVVRYASGDVYVLGDNLDAKAPGTYAHVALAASTAWALDASALARWTAGTGWVTSPITLPSLPRSVWATDEALWIALESGAIVRTDGAALVTIPSPSSGPFDFAYTRSRPIIIASFVAFEWTGVGWAPFLDSSIDLLDVVEDATGRHYLRTGLLNSSLRELAPDGSTRDILDGVAQLAPAGEGVLAIQQAIDFTGATFYAIAPRSPIVLSESSIGAIASDDRTPYAGFATGLFALTRGAWVPSDFASAEGFTQFPGGPLVRHEPLAVLNDVALWTPIAESCLVSGVRKDGTSVCATTNQVRDGEARIAIDGTPTLLWSDGDDEVAVAGDALFAYRDAGGWHTDTVDVVGLRFEVLAGASVTDLYAIARHPGGRAVFRFDGTAWSLLAPLDLVMGTGLAVLEDRVLALAPSGIVAIDRTSFATSVLPEPAPFVMLATGTADDAFAVSNIVAPGTSALWRFDGTTWTPVRLPDGLGSIQQLSRIERGDLLVVTFGGLIGYPALRLVRTRDW